MTNNKIILEKADKVAIAVAIAMFLIISAGLATNAHKMHQKFSKTEQIQKAQQQVNQFKTACFSKQK